MVPFKSTRRKENEREKKSTKSDELYIKKIIYWTVLSQSSHSCVVEIIGLLCFGWQFMLLCAQARQTDGAVWHGPSAQPAASGSLKCLSFCCAAALSLLRCDRSPSLCLSRLRTASERSPEGVSPTRCCGRASFWSAAGLKWRDKGRKSPPQWESPWIPRGRCELSLFLLPRFLPPEAPQARRWWTGTFSEESLAWKKEKITKKGVHPRSFFFIEQGLLSAQRQAHSAHKPTHGARIQLLISVYPSDYVIISHSLSN